MSVAYDNYRSVRDSYYKGTFFVANEEVEKQWITKMNQLVHTQCIAQHLWINNIPYILCLAIKGFVTGYIMLVGTRNVWH